MIAHRTNNKQRIFFTLRSIKYDTNHLLEIKDFCQSIWMDNLSRDLIESGDLKNMIVEKEVEELPQIRQSLLMALQI
jgi:hypothetical protein